MENEIYSGDVVSFGDIPMDYLIHYGIKGQKWGVRRYQNKDGSLTKAGRKRYAKLEAEMEKLGGKNIDNVQNKPKKAKDMTDDELRTAINRMRMEDEYNRMYNQLHPQKVKSGHKYVETLVSAGVTGLAEGGKQLIRDALIKKGKEALGIKDEKPKTAYEKLKESYDMEKLKQDYKKLKKGDEEDDYSKNKKDYDSRKLDYDRAKLEKDFEELLSGKAKDLQEEVDKELEKDAKRWGNKQKIAKAKQWFNDPNNKDWQDTDLDDLDDDKDDDN